MFALKTGSNLTSVFLEGIKLCPGFLFPSVTKSGNISPKHLDSEAAQARLSVYTTSPGDNYRVTIIQSQFELVINSLGMNK